MKTNSIIQLDYYPFGMLMPGRNFSSESYKLGFNNRSEKDNEILGIEGVLYSTHFRELDVRIGRWWSLDPKPFAFESHYASMGNNPILVNDPMGDIVVGDKKGMELYKAGREKIKKNISSLESSIENISKNNNGKLTKDQEKKLANLNEKLNSNKEADRELDQMEKSEYLFNIQTTGTPPAPDENGQTRSTGYRSFDLNVFDNSIGTVFHELKHGFQFLEGKLAYNIESGHGIQGIVDLMDEVEANNREVLLNSGIANYYKDGASLLANIPKYGGLPDKQCTIRNTKYSDINATYKGSDLFLQYLQLKTTRNTKLNYINYHKDLMRSTYEREN